MAGFSLIEMLLSIVIIGMLMAASAPLYNSLVVRNDLDIAGQQVAGALRRAQTYSKGSEQDSSWGVEIQSTAVTLFKGAIFASRNTGYDEVISLPGTVTVSGLTEVRFSKFMGAPSTTGTITLTSNANDSRSIAINAKGGVEY
jgi:prepilin-type N-terminal cleavage/methylation domain-containing protein